MFYGIQIVFSLLSSFCCVCALVFWVFFFPFFLGGGEGGGVLGLVCLESSKSWLEGISLVPCLISWHAYVVVYRRMKI